MDRFLSGLVRAPARVLLLDYDGTLAPFRTDRDRAFPYPGVREVLERFNDAGHTRVVVVSGRGIRDLEPLLGVRPPPELWGSHGWERKPPGGELETADPGSRARRGLDRAREAVRGLVEEEHVEVKPVSVAVHIRGLSGEDATAALEAVDSAWAGVATDHGLEVHAFDGGLELRVPGRDKGSAVREILEGEPEAAAVAYLGDDVTDEDAFRALEGRGLSVLVREEARDTAAQAWIRPPEELLAFLHAWLDRATTERA